MTTEVQTTDATNTPESATSQTAPVVAATVADTGSQTATTEGTTTETSTEQAAPAGAPEKYEFLAPEGQPFDDALIGAYSDVAKELDLPQDKAQKMLDKMGPVMAARQAEHFEQTKTKWAEDARGDKEFGGDKLDENLSVAIKARDAFATPELRTLLEETGLGNHPEVIRFFYRTGKAISEDSFVPGRTGSGIPQTTAQRMYPNMNP